MASRCLRARLPVASKSHSPPPKSAPPINAYRISAASVTIAMMSSRRMLQPPFFRFPELPPEERNQHDRQEQVNAAEHREWHRESRHRRHGFTRFHYAVNNPRLPAEFCHEPAGFQRNE